MLDCSAVDSKQATALAHPNLALTKYWGNRDDRLRIPANGSIALTLGAFETRTEAAWIRGLGHDELTINGQPASAPAVQRASAVLDAIRELAGFDDRARVVSANSFPTGAGLASSSSAFAALAVAAAAAAGLTLDDPTLSRIARRGSGSACRSIPGGYVEWLPGTADRDSFAVRLAGPEHWDLTDLVVLVDPAPKAVGSSEGHGSAATSPLQEARLADAPRRTRECREAVLQRDFQRLAQVVELDSDLMHAVMATSRPPLLYLQQATITVLQEVVRWRRGGIPVCYTVDAGPNPHLLTPSDRADEIAAWVRDIPGVPQILSSPPGGAPRVLSAESPRAG